VSHPPGTTVPVDRPPSTPAPGPTGRPVAVVTIPATPLAGASRTAALDPVLGRSPVQRHLHHLGSLGVAKVILLLDPALDGPATERILHEQIGELTPTVRSRLGISVVVAGDHVAWSELVGAGEYLLIRGDTIHDSRCYPLLLAGEGPRVLADGGGRGAVGRNGDGGAAIGMSRRETAAPGGGRPADLFAVGPPAPAMTPGTTIDIRTLAEYIPDLRRYLPVTWTPIRSEADQDRAARHLFNAAQKGVLDFPARYLHPVPENGLVRLLAGTPVTPNAVTILTGLLGFTATGLFATGRPGPVGAALAIALVVNVLDGVDGKLARVRLQASRFGDRLDHFLDVTFEFSWYLAIGWGLRATGATGSPLAAGIGLIGVMLASRALSGVYKAFSGRQIHDHRAFDRGFRLVAGRRNIYVLVLVIGWLAGRLDLALLLSLGWGAVTAAVYLVRSGMAWWVSRGAPRA